MKSLDDLRSGGSCSLLRLWRRHSKGKSVGMERVDPITNGGWEVKVESQGHPLGF